MEKLENEQQEIKDLLSQLLEKNTNAVETTNSLLQQYLNRTEAEMQKAADISVLFFSAGPNLWAILGHFLVISAILGHFWANLGNFGLFLGYFG